mmetsp:Transcript_29049/g.69177  ORF Transcript_29049/g.69177 Transcript_29049/m.69177 type:complete len:745 (-) Transcript_29049:80-2314(-)
MRVHVVENAEERDKDPEPLKAAKPRVPVPRFRSSWTGGTMLWNSEKTVPTPSVVWQWEHRTGYKPYDNRATMRIEDAFQRGLSRVRLKAGKMDDTPMELFFHDMIQFDPKTGNTRKIRRVGTDSIWSRIKRKANELAWLIETGRTQRVVFAQYEQRRRELHRGMDRRDYNVTDMYKDHGCFASLAKSNTFFLLSMVVVLLNSIWIGIEADAPATEGISASQSVIEHLFCVAFTAEVVIRFSAFKRKKNCLKDFWFSFDSSLVVLMVCEVWLVPIGVFLAGMTGGNTDIHAVKELTILRTVRLLRLTRLGRIARLLRAVPEVVTLLKGIAAAIRSVFFTLLLLLVLLFVFGVVFKTQAKEDFPQLEELFPNVPATMWVLLLSGTFLDSPSVALNEVGATSGWLVALFLVFIFLSHMMVLNMLIGILCDVVHQVALNEKEEAAVAYLKNTLLEILECHDKDNDRQIHRDEFELLMRNPEMHFVLTRFGVNVTDLINLRDVLFEEKSENDDEEEEEDLDTNSPLPSARRLRKLSFQEFLEVVLRLRGGNSATVTDIVDLREYVRQRFDRMDVRFHHAALSGSPVPLSRLRTMKSMPTRRHPLPHAPAQVEEEPPTPAQLPRLLGEDPETPKTPKRVQLDDRLDEGKSPSEKGSETEKEESPTKLRQLPKACLRKSEKTSGVPDPVMAKLEELGEMQHQMARRQATMHADLLHKYAELAEQVSATQGRLAQMASSRVLSEETQDADLR